MGGDSLDPAPSFTQCSQAPATIPHILLGIRVLGRSKACPQTTPNPAQETSQQLQQGSAGGQAGKAAWMGAGGRVSAETRGCKQHLFFILSAHNLGTYCVLGTAWTIPPHPRFTLPDQVLEGTQRWGTSPRGVGQGRQTDTD